MTFKKTGYVIINDNQYNSKFLTYGSKQIPKQGQDEKAKTKFNCILPKYRMDELLLHQKTFDEIQTVINAKRCWSKVFEEWGLQEVMKQRKNILVNLYGEPGTGKTMAAHAIAFEIQKKLVCVNYADIESKYVGETSKNLEAVFLYAKENDAILFFDEADALLSKRVTNMSNSTDVSVNQTRSVLLTLLNDYDGMVVFTTNFISNFDSAFMRRIQYHIRFELPNQELRERLWKRYIPKKMPTDIDIETISKKYNNISGSDISNAVLMAALKSANKGEYTVKNEMFEEAVQSIIKSKNANKQIKDIKTVVTTKPISEEYALSQMYKMNNKSMGD